MEAIIQQKVDLIAECLFSKVEKAPEDTFGLYSGEFGFLLFLLYYARYSQNEDHSILAEKYADRLLQQFAVREKLHTFCSGHSGILYLLDCLDEDEVIGMDVSEIRPFLENYLIFRMRQDIQRQNFDFMHGAMGVGLYFLKRKTNPEYIQEIVDFLYRTAEKDTTNNIFKWKSVVNSEDNIIGYNLALSHGISSILIFLSRAIRNGIINDQVRELLTGSVNFVFANQKDYTQFGSYFPSYIQINTQNPVSKSRMGWCYGDLGIGLALIQAGKALDNSSWEEKGHEILLQSTRRRQHNETFVNDAGICHGSAGIAMIFRRMFLETHREEYKEATSFWIDQTLHFSRYEDGLVGYKALEKDGMKCDYSLLSGIAGIGLVLLSYLVDDHQHWDEMFLLR